MILSLYIVGGTFLLNGIWWYLSKKYPRPIPSCLRWLMGLENPIAQLTHTRTLLEHLELRPSMQVLEVGCGPGRVTLPLARRLKEYQGSLTVVDIQQRMLQCTRKRAEAEHLDTIRYLHLDISTECLPKECYDRILLVTVLGELSHREAALRTLFHSLKEGGMLLIAESVFDPHYQKMDTLLPLVESIGFHIHRKEEQRCSFMLQLRK